MEMNVNMLDPVDFVGPVTRCQWHQHQWLFLIAVMYSTKL